MDVSVQKLIDFCSREGIYLYENKKQDVPDDKLVNTAEVVLRVKKEGIGCSIYFGNNIPKSTINQLFDQLSYVERLHLLEVIGIPIFPSKIGLLKDLESLIIDSEYISSLPKEIGELDFLKELVLRLENLHELPEWILSMQGIEILDLYGTQIKEIPKEINNLINLRILDLCCTHLKKLPHTILDLNLPFKDHFNEDDTPGIYLCDFTCENPSTEIVLGGQRRLKIYYNSNEVVSQNEVRVVLLGLKGCGKTSMSQRFEEMEDGRIHYKRNNSWTQGIAITTVKTSEGGVLHIWDFGGQEIMLSTHTLFLSDNCIYVIVLNARQGDEPERWLDYVSQYGRQSSVFIVNNHMDKADMQQIDINKLHRLYPYLNIITNDGKVWETSCEKPDKFPIRKLYQRILDEAKKYFEQKIPLSWKLLNSELGDMKNEGKSVNYITYEAYLESCEKCGVIVSDEQQEALNWLNDIGTIFTYGKLKSIDKMSEFKVLRPEWVTDAIYKIINNVKPDEGLCSLSHAEIRSALLSGKSENNTKSEYNNSEICFILEVMRKFSLSFNCSDSVEFIPAVAGGEEFADVAQWEQNPDDVILDVIYSLSQNDKQKAQNGSVGLANFYQVIIKIIEERKVFPHMWRSGALFQDMDNMQALLFLQNRRKWDFELRLMIKSINGEKDKKFAADFHQSVMGFLKDFAKNYKVDAKILISRMDDNYYLSVANMSKILLNNSELSGNYYIPDIDRRINIYDVLEKVELGSREQLKEVFCLLRNDVNEGNQKSDEALHLLQQIFSELRTLHIRIVEYERMTEKICSNEKNG